MCIKIWWYFCGINLSCYIDFSFPSILLENTLKHVSMNLMWEILWGKAIQLVKIRSGENYPHLSWKISETLLCTVHFATLDGGVTFGTFLNITFHKSTSKLGSLNKASFCVKSSLLPEKSTNSCSISV